MDAINVGFAVIPFQDVGYLAIFLIMLLDGANVPFTPNELFLSFTGYLARTGEVNIIAAYSVGLFGSFTGHFFSYFLGLKLGRPLFDRYGKFILITKGRLREGERAVKRFGKAAPFVIRFIPGLRNVGSLLLGIFKSPPGNFFLLTAAGIAIYNGLFFLTGYILAKQFAAFKHWVFPAVIFVIAAGLCFAAIRWYRTRKPKKKGRRRSL